MFIQLQYYTFPLSSPILPAPLPYLSSPSILSPISLLSLALLYLSPTPTFPLPLFPCILHSPLTLSHPFSTPLPPYSTLSISCKPSGDNIINFTYQFLHPFFLSYSADIALIGLAVMVSIQPQWSLEIYEWVVDGCLAYLSPFNYYTLDLSCLQWPGTHLPRYSTSSEGEVLYTQLTYCRSSER